MAENSFAMLTGPDALAAVGLADRGRDWPAAPCTGAAPAT